MRKERVFAPVVFDPAITRRAFDLFLELRGDGAAGGEATVVHPDGALWAYDDVDEFFADYRRYPEKVHLLRVGNDTTFQLSTSGPRSSLRIQLPHRAQIEQVFRIFEEAEPVSRIEPVDEPPEPPTIFIGHGRDGQWRLLGDHLRDQHGFEVVAYESGARAGHAIRDILEEMVSTSTFAFLVFTAEDQLADGHMRARQNVVHEAGLFQGALGFSRAVIVLEEGVENLSNLDGVQYIQFQRGNIREAFGDAVATVRREFFM
jgi:hypothetical protein